jgi:hypothetical protein
VGVATASVVGAASGISRLIPGVAVGIGVCDWQATQNAAMKQSVARKEIRIIRFSSAALHFVRRFHDG